MHCLLNHTLQPTNELNHLTLLFHPQFLDK
nr:MAG TPA: hypothetical protein [Caudoviricetes sp.]